MLKLSKHALWSIIICNITPNHIIVSASVTDASTKSHNTLRLIMLNLIGIVNLALNWPLAPIHNSFTCEKYMQKLSSYAFLASNLLFFFVGSNKNLKKNTSKEWSSETRWAWYGSRYRSLKMWWGTLNYIHANQRRLFSTPPFLDPLEYIILSTNKPSLQHNASAEIWHVVHSFRPPLKYEHVERFLSSNYLITQNYRK